MNALLKGMTTKKLESLIKINHINNKVFAFDERVKLQNPEKTSGDRVESQSKLPYSMVPIPVCKKWDTPLPN